MKLMILINKIIKILKKEDDKMKFETIAYEWLEYKKISVKESTYYNYMFIIEKYLKEKYENKKIEELINFNDLVQELSQKLSSKTIRDIINVLKAIIKYYEEEYGININYRKIRVLKLEKSNIRILSDKEKKKIEKYCLEENSLKSLGIIVCLNTGLRVGEICALKWENIDLENKNLYVKKTLQRVYDKKNKTSNIIIDRPKTECSVRCIPINKKSYEILKSIKGKYKDEDFFLTGEKYKFIEPRNYQNTFKNILKKSKVKTIKFHTLRHTFATNCIDVGMDIKALSEILGHSSVEITLNKYVHSSGKMKKKYLEKI